MMFTILVTVALLPTFILAASKDAFLKSLVNRQESTCEPAEPCQINLFKGISLKLCGCPESKECPNEPDTAITFKSVDYQFCGGAPTEVCLSGDVAWIRKGLKQSIKCICPAPLILHQKRWDKGLDITEHICDEPVSCEIGGVCAIREKIKSFTGEMYSNLQDLCECPSESRCSASDDIVVDGQVQKQMFTCQI